MLLVDNIDVPGIVGQIGSILGKNSINIAGMTFGREKPGGRAITVLNVDNPVSEDVLDEIKKSSNIKNVRLIKL
jgi:D-3-phosphoglycerate dehydrogenase